jgi:tRNA threonylcarbamoyladenosine biosynthesis protein TsaE
VTHTPILGRQHRVWSDEADCAAFAAELALRREPLSDAFIALVGPLGAGKTTFARHLMRALGVPGRIKSPTFALLEPYEVGSLVISHLDFYRFDDPREWSAAGLRDVFAAPGLKLVEWPDKAGDLLPTADLTIRLDPQDDGSRRVELQARTARGMALLP